MHLKLRKNVSLIFLVAVLYAVPVSAQQLDPTFGTNGVTVTEYPFSSAFSYSASLGTEGFQTGWGHIYIRHAGYRFAKSPTLIRKPWYIYRKRTNAQIADAANLLVSTDAAQQADGKIVAAGSTNTNYASAYDQGNWFVERVGPGGALDTTFSGGVVILDFGTTTERAKNVAIQPDGKILVSVTERNVRSR